MSASGTDTLSDEITCGLFDGLEAQDGGESRTSLEGQSQKAVSKPLLVIRMQAEVSHPFYHRPTSPHHRTGSHAPSSHPLGEPETLMNGPGPDYHAYHSLQLQLMTIKLACIEVS